VGDGAGWEFVCGYGFEFKSLEETIMEGD